MSRIPLALGAAMAIGFLLVFIGVADARPIESLFVTIAVGCFVFLWVPSKGEQK